MFNFSFLFCFVSIYCNQFNTCYLILVATACEYILFTILYSFVLYVLYFAGVSAHKNRM